MALGSAIHKRSSCLLLSPVKIRNRGGMDVWFPELTYPKRPSPPYDAAVCGQVMVLEFSCFSVSQKRLVSYDAPLRRKPKPAPGWSIPCRNEGFSGPGTSLREIPVYLLYIAYTTAAVPPKAANCL